MQRKRAESLFFPFFFSFLFFFFLIQLFFPAFAPAVFGADFAQQFFGDLSAENFLAHPNMHMMYAIPFSVAMFRVAMFLMGAFGSKHLREAVLVSSVITLAREMVSNHVLFPALPTSSFVANVVFVVWGLYIIYQNGISVYANTFGPARSSSDHVMRV